LIRTQCEHGQSTIARREQSRISTFVEFSDVGRNQSEEGLDDLGARKNGYQVLAQWPQHIVEQHVMSEH
jgi:hypothetical protein